MKKLILMLALLSAPAMAELEVYELAARCAATSDELGLEDNVSIATGAFAYSYKISEGDDYDSENAKVFFFYERGFVFGMNNADEEITFLKMYKYYCSDENMKLFKKLDEEFNKEVK